MTLTIARSVEALLAGATAIAIARPDASWPSVGSAATLAVVTGSYVRGMPAIAAGTRLNRVGSTTTASVLATGLPDGGPIAVAVALADDDDPASRLAAGGEPLGLAGVVPQAATSIATIVIATRRRSASLKPAAVPSRRRAE
jgi:hypothetical protein